jgi:hypothetical protein
MPPKTGTRTRRTTEINPEAVAEVETWKNVTPGIIAIQRLAEYGRPVHMVVQGGQTFSLTPGERRMNQNQTASRTQDIFLNGTLVPIALLEDEPDTDELRTNPNALAIESIHELFSIVDYDTFATRVNEVTNVGVVNRLLEEATRPTSSATSWQTEMVRRRQKQLSGDPDEALSEEERRPRAVTPR